MSEHLKCFREEYKYYVKTLDLLNRDDVEFLSKIKTQSLQEGNDISVFVKTETILQDRYMLFSWIEIIRIVQSPLGV